MSIKATAWALEQPLEPLPKVILIALADAHNGHTGRCFPAQEKVAQIARCSERTVREHLKALEGDGYIKRFKRFLGNGNRTSDAYTFPPLESPPADTAGGPPEVAASGGLPEASASEEPEVRNPKGSSPDGEELVRLQLDAGQQAPVIFTEGPRGGRKKMDPALALKLRSVWDAYCRIGDRRLQMTDRAGRVTKGASKVLDRVVENPDLALPDYEKILNLAMARPYWVKQYSIPKPDPGHIFNPEPFARLRELFDSGATPESVTADAPLPPAAEDPDAKRAAREAEWSEYNTYVPVDER